MLQPYGGSRRRYSPTAAAVLQPYGGGSRPQRRSQARAARLPARSTRVMSARLRACFEHSTLQTESNTKVITSVAVTTSHQVGRYGKEGNTA